jgi:hypothetical protein
MREERAKSWLRGDTQAIIKRDAEAAIPMAAAERLRLRHSGKSMLKALLLADNARGDLDISPRGRRRRRSDAKSF